MRRTRYGRKLEVLEELSAEELFRRLGDYLLDSGFGGAGAEFTLDELREAVLQALLSQAVIPLEELERLLDASEEQARSSLGRLVDRLVERLVREGLLGFPELGAQEVGELSGEARFELTSRGLDFLGFQALKEALAKAGSGSLGRHDTVRLATGVEAGEAPKPYEFGDALNLDAPATLLEALRRRGPRTPIDLEAEDLRVRQSELRVSAATVLMLDCSHSMVLYGEDRFTPAKRVALGLSHLVRTQFPGDELHLVLFHDGAEEVPLPRLHRVRVGPYHTNTAMGLEIGRRILSRSRKEIRTIIMITDGKPSAIRLPDGSTYTNSFGLDPFILKATFEQVVRCRRSGIRIHTFMLAQDRALIGFVKKVSEIARGRAYFTTPMTLGRYVTLDFLSGKLDTLN